MLFERMQRTCTLLRENAVPDGEGGARTAFEAVAQFQAALIPNKGQKGIKQQREAAGETFSVTAEVGLQFGQRFKDAEGRAYVVTNNAVTSPCMASFHFWQFDAERWEAGDDQ